MRQLIYLLIGLILFIACFPIEEKKLSDKSAMIELGHFLFFDKDLSWDRSKSCASCHDPQLGFVDGYKRALNGNAEILLRNTSSTLNMQNKSIFSWSNPSISTLQKQMERPLYATHPVEMGLKGKEDEIVGRIMQKEQYASLYQKAFSVDIKQLEFQEIVDCIVSYEFKLQSRNSKYDQFSKSRDTGMLSVSEWNGMNLFFSASLSCSGCHGGLDFDSAASGDQFANTGLYNCDSSYPIGDLGLQSHTGNKDDNGKFRIPSLRNVMITSPYYHDGSESNLEKVIENYERRGRNNKSLDCYGDGALHPAIDHRLKAFTLSNNEKKDLIAFLNTLTDTSYLNQYFFNDPFNWNSL